jgi:hypothetical protein
MNNKIMLRTALGAAMLALTAVSKSEAFDLSADRGRTIESLKASYSAMYYVYNVDPPANPGSNWTVPSVSGIPWFRSQFRTSDGKKVGLSSQKLSSAQFDFSAHKLNNGWFTPGPSQNPGCCGITPGWQDTYSTCPLPSMTGANGMYTSNPTGASQIWTPVPTGNYSLHIRNDPTSAYPGDKNRRNSDMWYTGTWTNDGSNSRYLTVETVDLPAGTFNLSDNDSMFVGPYSTDPNKGKITLSQTTTYNMTSKNEMIGYQAKQMKATLTGGKKAVYTIKAGSSVSGMFAKSDLYSTPL